MIPIIFNTKRRLQFKKRCDAHFVKHDFLHREIFLNHLERLSMILQDMEAITFIDVPDYFLELPEAVAFFKLKKTTQITNIRRQSDIFPPSITNQNAIIALLTCHAVNDLVGYFVQIKNALCEDGVFIASFFGENNITLLKNAFVTAELEITKGCHNRFYPIIDIRTLGGLLQRAGFTLPVADSENYTVHYKDVKTIIQDMRGMGESNCLMNPSVSLRRDVYTQALENLKNAVPSQIFNIDIVTITGRSPSEAQQKPLKAGSAQVSLTKVL